MFDLPWLFAECPRLKDVPVLLVHGERDRQGMTKECKAYANVTPVAPPLPIAYGTHHTKMFVALYPEKVRVAVFTANFLSGDWNTKTQGVWYQDFGLKVMSDSDEEEEKTDDTTANAIDVFDVKNDFEADLVLYLSSLGPQVKLLCGELKRFDFSVARVALVSSVPGVYKGKDMEKYGHLRVRKLLKMFKIPPTDNPLICQRNSLEGWNAGRSIPCPLKNMKPFLHKYLRKWTPPTDLHRQNAMPHIKTYARFDPSDERAGELDWAILSSSNLSKAAWGTFQKNRMQFMIRSYELGVMFLPPLLSRETGGPPTHLVTIGSKLAQHLDAETIDGATCRLPLPYNFPLSSTTYNPKKDEPWVWDLVRESPDIFGSAYILH
ncbi:hypothetical protein BBJ29_008559 [Phytophthora kernoviae]|uniref:Tyrosyl-DNA phosphodiesterase 1 n=1 Tax=Phytophthora kernoviae TaxID=325452 RepID=A0A3F2RPV7_9STRA|nr:hypothetical protein BBJ29_008559 [Phytophthora kernoviae]RLN61946.1 hypothetical protein BBP00_00005075 [Phytophthora kernoviae]